MKVYRYLSENELKSILTDDLSNVGYEYANNLKLQQSNTHRYKKGIKYLHFFKSKADCVRIKAIHNNKTNFYIAEFNIPFATLAKHIGYGIYSTTGYDVDYDEVTEFAIPTHKLKSSYLISYEPATNIKSNTNTKDNNYIERS